MLSLQSTVSRVARNVANCQRRQWKAQSKIYCRTFSSFVQEKNFSTKYKPVEATSYAEANLDLPISRLLRPKATRTEDVRQMLSLEGPRNKDWWTGVHPEDCAGFDISTKKLHSLPQINFARASCSKDSLRNYFNNTWCLTETLLSSLQGEEAFVRPPYHELRHPMIFYYGHPAAFYINKLRVAGLIATGINPFFEVIFETGVDEMSWDDLSKNKMDWPSVAEVHQYRQQVFNTVHSVIDNLSDAELSNINKESKVWSLLMAFEHERIHLETSSVLISELPVELVSAPQNFPGYFPSVNFVSTQSPAAGADYPVNNMISVPSTTVKLGRPETSPCFGWDNEYGYREFTLPEFNVSQYKVSNGEFLEFVKAGGYSQQEFWSTDGWKWRAFRNSKWPSHWVRKGPQGLHQFNLRLLFDVVDMQWDWPVVVNFHEASAFAAWKAKETGKAIRVITELEHRAIRDETNSKTFVDTDDAVVKYSGHEMISKGKRNLNLNYASMSPVNFCQPNAKGFNDVFGNAWEWTMDYFCALPGFQVHPYYEDFSTPCFDGLHNVIQGGSFISSGNEASFHSRFHFRPHFFQHASFRLVENLSPGDVLTSDVDAPGPYVGDYPFRRSSTSLKAESVKSNMDAIQRKRNLVKSMHYGSLPDVDSELKQTSSIKAFSSFVLNASEKLRIDANAKVLEVGCGPGGLSFQLAKRFPLVMAVDHDSYLIEEANRLKQGMPVHYTLASNGGEAERIPITAEPVKHRIDFRCADPMCLPAEMSDFDIVSLNDVIDKISSPSALLSRLAGVRGLVKPGGLLTIWSKFQWNEDRTPKPLWIGQGHIPPVDDLLNRLSEDFALVDSQDLTVLWRESKKDLRGGIYSAIALQRK